MSHTVQFNFFRGKYLQPPNIKQKLISTINTLLQKRSTFITDFNFVIKLTESKVHSQIHCRRG